MGVTALHTAATGMAAQLKYIDVIANNMANINTHGFRRDRVNFADLFYSAETLMGSRGPGDRVRPSAIQVGNGVRMVSTQKIFEHGGVEKTDNELDLAITKDENAFFPIELPGGQTVYTRNGAFTRNEEGTIVTADGDPLAGGIAIPNGTTQVTIARDGTVTAIDPVTPQGVTLGQIQIARFLNPAGLRPLGDNVLAETAASGAPIVVTPGEQGAGQILQFHLENSNVQAVKELVKFIQAQRSYEINSNVVRTSDQALQLANNLRG